MARKSLLATCEPEGRLVTKPEEVEELARLYGSAKVISEAGFDYVHIEKLKFVSDGEEVEVEALLCPQLRDGYSTRLFLVRPFTNKGQNWSQHSILGKSWHSWSWQHVPADQRLVQILLCHLNALR